MTELSFLLFELQSTPKSVILMQENAILTMLRMHPSVLDFLPRDREIGKVDPFSWQIPVSKTSVVLPRIPFPLRA